MNNISGHGFQYKIEDRVKACGYETFSEQSYIDDAELKPRDIDFVAIQKRESHNPRGNQLALIVECKYLLEDAQCYMRPNPQIKNPYFVDGYSTEKLFQQDGKFHYLLMSMVAKNITPNKKADLQSAVMQASKAMLYLRGPSHILNAKGMFFPIVVYGGPGKILDQDGKEHKNFMYFHTYEWKEPHTQDRTVSRNIYVDIIHESSLEEYMENLYKSEMDILMGNINFDGLMSRNDADSSNRDEQVNIAI